MEKIHPLLSQEIQRYIKQGYRVVSQTETTAQLVKPKQFGCLTATLLTLLTAGIFLLFYLFYYASKKDETIYLAVVDDKIKVTRG